MLRDRFYASPGAMTASGEGNYEGRDDSAAEPPGLSPSGATTDEARPKVSIGLPVRNAERFIRRAIESVLAQTFSDFELVICDNVSDDGTVEIVREYAERDARVRLCQNEANIGQIRNMNRVFELSRGEYFRWTGDDDWFDREYLEKSVAYLEDHPEFIAVTCYVKYSDDDGNEFYAEYTGERMESFDTARRFDRLLHLLVSDYRYSDTHYALYRASALKQTDLLPFVYGPDRVLSAQLVLVGPFGHIPECLFYRRRVPAHYSRVNRVKALHPAYNPDNPEALRPSTLRLAASINALLSDAALTPVQELKCRASVARFAAVRIAKKFPGEARFRLRMLLRGPPKEA